MSWLNYHHLLYFWTVARAGSIAKASQELHLAQPTISAQLKLLEESLGHIARQLELVRRRRDEIAALEGELVARRKRVRSLLRELAVA